MRCKPAEDAEGCERQREQPAVQHDCMPFVLSHSGIAAQDERYGHVPGRACRRNDWRQRWTGSIAWLLRLILVVLGVVGCGEETGEGTGVAGEISFDLAGQSDANISGARAV